MYHDDSDSYFTIPKDLTDEYKGCLNVGCIELESDVWYQRKEYGGIENA